MRTSKKRAAVIGVENLEQRNLQSSLSGAQNHSIIAIHPGELVPALHAGELVPAVHTGDLVPAVHVVDGTSNTLIGLL